MISELQAGVDRSLVHRYGTVADRGRVERARAALEANGITVLRATDRAEARRIVLDLIPEVLGF